MARYLFVYGTLMRSAAASELGREERARLEREALNLGAASICARLYDLGRYPGLAIAEHASERVHGELLLLQDPAITLAWLDEYEGIDPGDAASAEYERVEVDVLLADGSSRRAAVYRCRTRPDECVRLATGRWSPHRPGIAG